ncbi:MAG: DUF1648 domain-containing protein [Phycisphaerales bacterium]
MSWSVRFNMIIMKVCEGRVSSKRPKIELPITLIEIVFELAGIMAIFSMILILSKYWPSLPETIPTHFGFSGKPDGWGGKESLLFLPILGTFMYICMWFLSKYPHIYNYPVTITEENAPVQYLIGRKIINWTRTFVAILFGYLEWASIQGALGKSPGLGPWFILVVLLFSFAPIIYYIMQARQGK